MFIYEKTTDNTSHLYGTLGTIPSVSDNQLVYKDNDGDTLTIVANDTYIDGGSSGGIQRIIRKSDNKAVNVCIGDTCVIGEIEEKIITTIKVTTKPTKLTYVKDETLDLTGMVVTATYEDGDTAILDSDTYTTSPANGATLDTAGSITITVTHTASSKTCTFSVTVTDD